MKRLIAIMVTLVVLMTTLPACAVAPTSTTGNVPEAVILRVKELFAVDDGYEDFNVDVERRGNETYYSLHWYDPTETLPSVDVTTTEKRVISYRMYPSHMIPTTTKALATTELEASAKDLLKKLLPDLAAEFTVTLSEQTSAMMFDPEEVEFQFFREREGIVVLPQYVTVGLNRYTGELTSYQLVLAPYGSTGEVKFPTTQGLLDEAQAKAAYEKHIRIVPAYMRLTGNRGQQVEYKPIYTNLNPTFDVDAKTGEPVIFNAYAVYRNDMDVAPKSAEADGAGPTLTPEEQLTVDRIKGLKPQSEAEAVLHKTGFIPDAAKLSQVYVGKRYDNPELYQYSFNYKAGEQYYYAAVDAQNLDILSLNRSFSSYGEKMSAEEAAKVAQKAVAQYAPEVQDQVELLLYPTTLAESYTFNFVRKLHDRYVIGDGLTVTVHGKTGYISDFSKFWYEGDIEPVQNDLGLKSATERFWQSVPLYPAFQAQQFPADGGPLNTALVYTTGLNQPVFLDAFTGTRLTAQGQPDAQHLTADSYVDWDKVEHPAELLELLAMGIGYPPGKLSPQGNLTQQEFYRLLLPVRGYDAGAIDEPTLIRAGLVKKGEYRPQEPMKKLMAVKALIRADGSEDVAAISGIFRALTEDTKNLGSDLGYMTLAVGKGYVPLENGKLTPQKILTREEGAMLIYHFTHPLPYGD